jgi:hypothetical protein
MTGRHGGYPTTQWNAAKEEMRAELITVAATGQTISYSGLVSRVRAIEFDPRSPLLFEVLGEISTEENALGRGMLSVVVIHQEGDQMPGEGFFTLARALGRRQSDRDMLWITEFQRVQAAYRAFAPRPESVVSHPSQSGRFREETELHRAGYKVTDLSDFGRWQVLSTVAVPQLGLRVVAETIAGLVRVRKLQRLGRSDYQRAIDRWETDLARLKIEYRQEDFPWPSTEP